MNKTLYVVSGFMRTGTSMMMRALEAGDMTARYKQSRDEMKTRYADEFYDPNIGGLYELERNDYKHPSFPHNYEGCLIKALNYAVPRMAVMGHGIRVVFMRRDSEEIRQSYEAFFRKRMPKMDNLCKRMNDIIDRIYNRKDVLSLNVFWYRDVVDNPIKHFEILASDGWPIDVEKAASIVDPKFCRFRLELLEVGI